MDISQIKALIASLPTLSHVEYFRAVGKIKEFMASVGNNTKTQTMQLSDDDIEQLSQSELAVDENDSKSTKKKTIKEWLQTNVLGKHVVTSDGKLVVFNSEDSLDHIPYNIASRKSKAYLAEAVPSIPLIFAKGEFVGRKVSDHDRKDKTILAFHEYQKEIKTSTGKTMFVEVHAAEREHTDGLSFAAYNIKKAQKEKDRTTHADNTMNDSMLDTGSMTVFDNNHNVIFDKLQVNATTNYQIPLRIIWVKNSDGEIIYSEGNEGWELQATQSPMATKEDIKFTTNRIKELAQNGVGVRITDIDWDAIEADENQAEKTITKPNIMGKFDFETMRDNDVDPNVGYIIQKVLDTVASKPYWDIAGYLGKCKGIAMGNASIATCQLEVEKKYSQAEQKSMARKAYVLGIESLKARLEDKTTVRDVYDELILIGQEMNGAIYASEDRKILSDLNQQTNEKTDAIRSLTRQLEIEAHNDMGWQKRSDTILYLQNKYPERQIIGNSYFIADKAIMDEYNQLLNQTNQFKADRFMASLENNPSKLAWISLGEKFWAIASNTSRSFVKEVNEAIRKKYSDWGLVIPKEVIDPKTGKVKLKTKSTFEVQVADTIERISDKQVNIQSPDDLINIFGLRDVGAGSWSNKKKDELQWHMQKCGEAMVDLSDIVGIDPKLLGFNGRLTLTFGVGDKKNVRAHYSPLDRSINMSKMKGGGSFGHEWWHAIDNILVSVINGNAAPMGEFLSKTPAYAERNPRLADAFRFLNVALNQSNDNQPLNIRILEAHVNEAINAFENPNPDDPYAKTIIGFGNQDDALAYLNEQDNNAMSYKTLIQIQTWKQHVVLYYNQDKIGQTITLPIGYGMSEFRKNAIKLDGGKAKYWASVHEMAARAFAHYLDRKLIDKGQKSGYLTYETVGNAFPSGKESDRIIKAFDKIFEIIRDEKILENAVANKALMDSIFGEKPKESFFTKEDFSQYVDHINSPKEPKLYGDVLVFDDDLKILLVKRVDNDDFAPGKWWIPGGKIEDGESFNEGASRELMEETNIRIAPFDLKFIESKQLENGGISHRFAGEMNNSDIQLQPEELQSYYWVHPNDLDKYDLLGQASDLKNLIQTFQNLKPFKSMFDTEG